MYGHNKGGSGMSDHDTIKTTCSINPKKYYGDTPKGGPGDASTHVGGKNRTSAKLVPPIRTK
jgi:hypothetical protein